MISSHSSCLISQRNLRCFVCWLSRELKYSHIPQNLFDQLTVEAEFNWIVRGNILINIKCRSETSAHTSAGLTTGQRPRAESLKWDGTRCGVVWEPPGLSGSGAGSVPGYYYCVKPMGEFSNLIAQAIHCPHTRNCIFSQHYGRYLTRPQWFLCRRKI